ncbi:MAG: protein kinase [Gemmatimonadetes bacterium]|nr:protein kinase [Gemmatimonadota bacterium]
MIPPDPRVRLRDDWHRLEPLLDAVLDAPEDARPARIAELSGDDAALRAHLTQLVLDCGRPYPLLDQPAAERFPDLFAGDDTPYPVSLTERYRPVRELGHGGMAVVYLARDEKHSRDVAVKVIRRELAAALGRERFLREIAIVSGLRHPHVVPLFDSGEADGALYYVMPYEEGDSLRDRLHRDGALAIATAVGILTEVCGALAFAHGRGIVHRDVKPENILLVGEHATVTDFGIALVASAPAEREAAAAGTAIGTPAYMSPEQIRGDPHVDHRTDIYAVGVVAYEMLAGVRPFVAALPDDLADIPMQRPPAIAERRPEVPPALAAIVARCLERRPEDRWQSVDELLVRLRGVASADAQPNARRRTRTIAVAGALALLLVVAAEWSRRHAVGTEWRNPLADARVERITDLPGSEVDAAISADGRHAAFLADSAGRFDAYVTQIGSGHFVNLTGARVPELFNEDVRNIGFTPDGKQVWLRTASIGQTPHVSLVPSAGGVLKTFLDRAVMVAWSPDGRRVAYHEGGEDPIYVAGPLGEHPRRIFTAGKGRHSHYLSWSPDGSSIYFANGVPPSDMDIWRVPADGGVAERITHHNAGVAYPVMLDDRTLLYVTTAEDGTGPWLYALDVNERVPRRISAGVEHTLSLSASAHVAGRARRLVTTVSNPTGALWSVSIAPTVADEGDVTRMAHIPTARAQAPRFAPDGSLFYLASRSGADGLWKLERGVARELWDAREGAVAGPPSVSPDGRTVCAPVRRQQRSRLECTGTDGTGRRVLAESLDVRGAGSWSPDGAWIAIAAQDSVGVRVYRIPVAGGPPVNLVATVSSNPLWSPDGTFILYSGTPSARVAPVFAITPEGRPHPMPALFVDRLGDSYRFLPGGRQLVVKQGGFRRQDFFSFDLATGAQRQLTRLRHGDPLWHFDISPDGRRILFARVNEHADVVLLELPR